MSKKWVHILLYTFIYLQIPPYTTEYLYIPLYTPIHIKISNIRKMRSEIRPQNGHKSSVWGHTGIMCFWLFFQAQSPQLLCRRWSWQRARYWNGACTQHCLDCEFRFAIFVYRFWFPVFCFLPFHFETCSRLKHSYSLK